MEVRYQSAAAAQVKIPVGQSSHNTNEVSQKACLITI